MQFGHCDDDKEEKLQVNQLEKKNFKEKKNEDASELLRIKMKEQVSHVKQQTTP